MTLSDAERSVRSYVATYVTKPKVFIVTRGIRIARAAVIVACAVALSVLVADRVLGVALNNLRAADLRVCHRLNILRADENRNWLRGYIVLAGSGLRGAEDLGWIPLTVCHAAVYHNSYPAPTPIPFEQRLPPPSALRPGPLN